MTKGKGRRITDHIDNYRRGGMKNLGHRFLDHEKRNAAAVIRDMTVPQGGENMAGINNPLGALSALAGLAQSKNDPMAALSALGALGSSGAGTPSAAASGSGGAAGGSPADLLNLLSTLKPQQSTSPPNMNNANNMNFSQNMNNTPRQRMQNNRNEMNAKPEQVYASEPNNACDNCKKSDEGCRKSFRNYPSWQQVNIETAPWKKADR